MEAKKMSSKAKSERLKVIRAKSAARRTAIAKSIETEAELAYQEKELKASFADEKSLRSLSSVTGYLSVAVALNTFFLVVQTWATLKAGYFLTSVSFVYIFLSVALIGSLVWCIRLLKQRRLLAMWVFIGYVVATLFFTLAFRLYSGNNRFAPSDVVVFIVQAAILFEIYRLKKKDILN